MEVCRAHAGSFELDFLCRVRGRKIGCHRMDVYWVR